MPRSPKYARSSGPLTSDDTYERHATEGSAVMAGGACACKRPPADPTVIVERVQVSAGERAAGEPMEAVAEPATAFDARGGRGICAPWVTVAKNPERFQACVAAARRLGQIDTPSQLFDALCKFTREDGTHVLSVDQEVFWVVLFDTHNYIRGVGEIARGARDRVQVPIPDVLRLPILDGATAFAILHTHPSGKANPSEADKRLTRAIERAGLTVDLPLFDHLVIGSGEFYSFRAKKLYRAS